ncbi:MAG: hypothetical protein CVV64_07270 [Candidatus Wallbacteria bacterium HGW-Wallbacteria-1]|jgi:Tfp pilus assembly PilM family ATPase|uniref:SHS2 domain-containing protein n=1 Tax=Candidatus Wallbacteria bacterium HGW-Wallbacteria-1 TaxID=2013854 RepID=A0A2N1PQP8_9BACT|nr:MAG: hypothetical protein CVV64_07270 [Candidatus Wallbacteria bacterium HGW-Wallbacteria-1]
MKGFLPNLVLSVGNSSVKAAIFEGTRGNRRVLQTLSVKTGSTLFQNPIAREESLTNFQELVDAISKLRKQISGKVGDCLLQLSDSFCIERVVQLGLRKTTQESTEELEREVGKILPEPVGKYNLSHMIVGVYSKLNLALAVATMKHNMDQIIKAAVKAGFNPVMVSPKTPDNLNLFHEFVSLPGNQDRTIAIVRISHRSSTISIFRNACLRHVQNIAIGGHDFSKTLAQGLKISLKNAEEIKRGEVIFLPQFAQEQNGVSNFIAIKPALEELVRSLFGALEQYFQSFDDNRIDQVLIMGAGSRIPNLEVALSHYLNAPVMRAVSLVKGVPELDISAVPDDVIDEFGPLLGTQKRI